MEALSGPGQAMNVEMIRDMTNHFKAANESNKLAARMTNDFFTHCLKCDWKQAQLSQNAAVDAYDSMLLHIVAAYKRAEILHSK